MSIVTLVSGGLDSTLMAVLSKESNVDIYPLLINYGQKAYKNELLSCQTQFKLFGLPAPVVANLSGLGELIPCGLTSNEHDIYNDAFFPGRNFFFLLTASSYAYRMGASGVAIGLLSDEFSIFPDQTSRFIEEAEKVVEVTMGRKISILTPLMSFSKKDVVELAFQKNIKKYYSCHEGTDKPCGRCIACKEYDFQIEV